METIESIKNALYRFDMAIEAVKSTINGEDPHAAALAINEAEKASEVLKTWSQPEYIRQLINSIPAENDHRVQRLHSGQVTRRASVALEKMDSEIVSAVMAAKNAGVPQGLIVALLHGHAHAQTSSMIDED